MKPRISTILNDNNKTSKNLAAISYEKNRNANNSYCLSFANQHLELFF
ncbi:hypothetical protein [Methanobrevibacter cuticularis]|nr:hypothetical protein [Methanobrevibacter cuticularis]